MNNAKQFNNDIVSQILRKYLIQISAVAVIDEKISKDEFAILKAVKDWFDSIESEFKPEIETLTALGEAEVERRIVQKAKEKRGELQRIAAKDGIISAEEKAILDKIDRLFAKGIL